LSQRNQFSLSRSKILAAVKSDWENETQKQGRAGKR